MQRAFLIGRIATGEIEDRQPATLPAPTPEQVRQVMSMLGRAGGKKGGLERARRLSDRRRRQIASQAAKARWRGKGP